MKRLTACLLALMLCAALIPAALAGSYTTGPITYTVWDGWTESKSSDSLVYYYHNTDGKMDGMLMVMTQDLGISKSQIDALGFDAIAKLMVETLGNTLKTTLTYEVVKVNGEDGARFKGTYMNMACEGVLFFRGGSMAAIVMMGESNIDVPAMLTEVMDTVK